VKHDLPSTIPPHPERTPQGMRHLLRLQKSATSTVRHEGHVRLQALHLKIVQQNSHRPLLPQRVDNLSLVEHSAGAAKLSEVRCKQSGKFFTRPADRRIRHQLFERPKMLVEGWIITHEREKNRVNSGRLYTEDLTAGHRKAKIFNLELASLHESGIPECFETSDREILKLREQRGIHRCEIEA